MLRARDPWILAGLTLLILIAGSVVVTSLSWTGSVFPGFLTLDNRVVASAGLSDWPAIQEPIYQAEIVAIDGRPVTSAAELRLEVAGTPPGTPILYSFERAGERFEHVFESRTFSARDWTLLFGSYLFCGLGLCGMALAIRRLRSSSETNRGAMLFLWIGGVWALSAADLYGPSWWFRVHAIHECLLFAGALHMALVFPQPPRWLRRHRWVIPSAYAAALLLAAANQWALYDPDGYRLTHGIAVTAFAASLVVLIGTQVWGWFRPRSFEARQRMKVVVLGSVVALTPQAILIIGGLVSERQASENAMAFSGIFYPLSIGYAVLRSDLLEVDAFVRRSISYLLVTVGIALGFAGTLALGNATIGPSFAGSPAAILVPALLGAAFLPLARGLQVLVDRIFYRGTAGDFRRIVSEASSALTTATRLGRVREILVSAVTEALKPSFIQLDVHPLDSGDAMRDWTDLPDPVLAKLHANGLREPVDWEPGGLVVPFAIEGRLVAALSIGRPLSGDFYGAEDRQLLRTLANQGAIALQNALAVEDLRELNQNLEGRVRVRTSELEAALSELRETQSQLVHQEKMASVGQLVAGVAHEINNPLNFIQGNLYHLRSYSDTLGKAFSELEACALRGADEEAVREIRARHDLDYVTDDLVLAFDGCREGVDRATAIVKDLRTFSRDDRGTREELDVNDALDTTLNLLGSHLHQTEVVREYDADLPRIECFPGQLGQVFINLIANAADAVGEGGRITLRTRAQNADWIVVEVEDDGPGIEAEHVERIFEPFFTTKEVGKGTGLGLAISYGVISRHGGRLGVSSQPGQGAVFSVELPVKPPEEAPPSRQDEPGDGR